MIPWKQLESVGPRSGLLSPRFRHVKTQTTWVQVTDPEGTTLARIEPEIDPRTLDRRLCLLRSHSFKCCFWLTVSECQWQLHRSGSARWAFARAWLRGTSSGFPCGACGEGVADGALGHTGSNLATAAACPRCTYWLCSRGLLIRVFRFEFFRWTPPNRLTFDANCLPQSCLDGRPFIEMDQYGSWLAVSMVSPRRRCAVILHIQRENAQRPAERWVSFFPVAAATAFYCWVFSKSVTCTCVFYCVRAVGKRFCIMCDIFNCLNNLKYEA